LRQCVESVLAQRFDGSIVLLIGDDCSTDGTQEWLRSLQERHPAQVRLFLAKRNLWNEVFSGSAIAWPIYREAAKARYAALLEGDDYWIDENKLRRQVEHLEEHPGSAGCFTDCRLVDSGGETIDPRPFWTESYRQSYSQRDCLTTLRSSYGTGTLVFRGTVLVNGLPEYFWRAGSDFLLDLAVTEHGSLDHLPGESAAYRIHTGGSWQGTSRTPQYLQGLVRLRALEADGMMTERFRGEIAAMRKDLLGRLLNLRPALEKGPKFPSLEPGEIPCLTSAGMFDYARDPSERLDSWLEASASISWRVWSVVLVLRDGAEVEIAWRGGDGGILHALCKTDDLVSDNGGIDLVLPDLASWEGIDRLSGCHVPAGLSSFPADFGGDLKRLVMERLAELHQARTRLSRIENSRYWRLGKLVRNVLGGGGRS
jgi:glycosyltransferase involved in cell wall biosynthesis